MYNSILTAPYNELKDFNSLFIEMTAKNCNLKCKHCYIDFSDHKKVKDFIPIDKIKQSLTTLKQENIKFIHLSGAEPMLHPDFNAILRLCLKHASVVVHTNGMNINDKKARFLKKVEEENNLGNEIIFRISIDHYDERQNDELRGRGSFRKAVHAIQSLAKYYFNPILSIVNYWNEDEKELKNSFKMLCKTFDFETDDINFSIVPYLDKKIYASNRLNGNEEFKMLDCAKSRTLSNTGIYNCLLLVGDHRGRCGTTFDDYSRKNYLETEVCSQCIKNRRNIFTFNWY